MRFKFKKKLFYNNFINNSFKIGFSSVISRGALFYRDFLLALLLGPSFYGKWTQIIIFLNYTLHLPFGFQNVLSRDVPFALGKNEFKTVDKIQSITLSISLLGSFLFIFFILLSKFFFSIDILKIDKDLILFFIILVFLQQIYAYLSILIRAHQNFNLFSIGSAALPIINLILLLFIYKYINILSALFCFCMSYLFINIYWIYKSPFSIKSYNENLFSFKNDFFEYYKTAFPLFLTGLLGMLILSIDRLMISHYYDSTNIGIYSFAFMLTQSISFIVGPIYQVVYPKMMNSFGLNNLADNMKNYFIFLIFSITLIVLLLISFIYFYFDNIILNYIKQFSDSIPYLNILLISSVFFIISNGANTISTSLNDQKKVIKLQSLIILIQFVAIFFICIFKFHLLYVALTMLTSSFLYSILSVYYAGTIIFKDIKFVYNFIRPVYSFFIFSIIFLFLIKYIYSIFLKESILSSILCHLSWIFMISILFIQTRKILSKYNFVVSINFLNN
jgi:stage V sporulation protein B